MSDYGCAVTANCPIALSDYNCAEWLVKNEAANAPITFEEQFMIKPYYKTRTYARGNYSIGNIAMSK